jgi:enolase
MSASITRVHAREVLDSRGNPTVEVDVHCDGGARGRGIVPSGASTGTHEAIELRDGDPQRYRGKGVRKAVNCVREVLGPAILGMDATQQSAIDEKLCDLDGTPNKSRLGANAILGVSLACAHAAAACRRMPLWRYLREMAGEPSKATLPTPMVNMISGGLHAGGNLDFQDFLLMPLWSRGYSESLEMIVAVYRTLGEELARRGFEGVLVGDEGGYGPRLQSHQQAVEILLSAIDKAGLAPGKDAGIALDVAASHFHRDGKYHLRAEGGKVHSSDDMIELLRRWLDAYPVVSIEDALAENDWEGWRNLTAALGNRVQLVGDDLFATNPERLRRGIDTQIANAVLVKMNQIGTLTETLEVVRLARSAGYRCVFSARSGETEDSTLADLSVGMGPGQIKIGSVARSERLAKYNQLVRIEEELQG